MANIYLTTLPYNDLGLLKRPLSTAPEFRDRDDGDPICHPVRAIQRLTEIADSTRIQHAQRLLGSCGSCKSTLPN